MGMGMGMLIPKSYQLPNNRKFPILAYTKNFPKTYNLTKTNIIYTFGIQEQRIVILRVKIDMVYNQLIPLNLKKKKTFQNQFFETPKLTKILHLTNYSFLPTTTHVIQPKIKILHPPLHSFEIHI